VIGLVLLVSTGACVLALALVADSSTPFDHAFAAQRGAHVIAVVDPARATSAELAAVPKSPTALPRNACSFASSIGVVAVVVIVLSPDDHSSQCRFSVLVAT